MFSLLCALVFFALPLCAQESALVRVWDLGGTRPGQLTVYNPDSDDAEFGTPVRAGDLNGDGYDDLVISAMAGDGPPGPLRPNAGEVAVYFSPGFIGGRIDLRQAHDNVVTVYGQEERAIFGIKTEVADLDGDGRNDLLVGSFYANAGDRTDAGKLYILSGHLLTDRLEGTRTIDLARAWPPGILGVIGPEPRSRLGVWVAAGDIDGDGVQDAVIGADQASGWDSPGDEAGRVYVLYGPLDLNGTIDLATSQHPMTVIYGVDAMDHLGSSLGVGDVDGDGRDDVAMGAAALGTLRNAYDRVGGAGDGPDNSRPDAGDVYVFFGRAERPAVVDLRRADDGMTIYGADGGGSSPDRMGEEIVAADINGDGFDDLMLGAYRADGPDNSRPDAGDTYVVYGASDRRGQVLDMAQPPVGTTIIYGASDRAISGDALAAGDVNGDGYDDLFIGVPGDRGPLNRRASGGIVVIAGGPELPGVIDLAAPSVPIVWIQAPDPADYSAYWAASGDMDGDGYIDVMPNGMAGDGPDNDRNNAGEAHVVSGRLIADMLGDPTTAVGATDAVPQRAVLWQNYPNPFNGSTLIHYAVERYGEVDLAIYDLLGQRLATLWRGRLGVGLHAARWDGRSDAGVPVASGAYIYRLSNSDGEWAKTLVLLK